MSNKISFSVEGEIRGKERARSRGFGKKPKTPDQTIDYEAKVKAQFLSAVNPPYPTYLQGVPVHMTIVAYFAIPKSYSEKKRKVIAAGELFPTKVPDWDNISKIISDALNKLAYHDDAQVVSGNCFKRFTAGPSRVDVILRQQPHRWLTQMGLC